jgi:hypothetical protein
MTIIEKIGNLIQTQYTESLNEYRIHCETLGLPLTYRNFVGFLKPNISAAELRDLQPACLTNRAAQLDKIRLMEESFQEIIESKTGAL